MASKMLIDAAHSEETRVVVVRGNRIEEFDYESAQRKQLKGNIYLAKVTRVEPSLQAAFVDYGGNRHGFLAFSEIHPDYYQIPVADRQALLEEEEEDVRRSEEDFDAKADAGGDAEAADSSEDAKEQAADTDAGGKKRKTKAKKASSQDEGADDDNDSSSEDAADVESSSDEDAADDDQPTEKVDSVGAEDALEEVPQRQRRHRRNYKIQEVIKRRQVILVQVVKEERGNKGAALTTYLSLAGRYCVLMPNTARGGGISRKITDANDRRRLKEVARDTKVQPGMGLIVRTAGAQRTKAEIKRDFDYLMRLWGTVRDLTLESTAPTLVYEEGSLIKRSIRDLYTKDVDEILVEGEAGVKEAKAFMKMLMPSHARHVKAYKETQPLFSKFQVESQLDGLFSNTVTLQSGGYMVMNQTEALVAIDINSGKATREHNIEDTALKTNQEAAQEIARQLRLRDLAGLIVIDFIDMEEKRNNRAVERKLKDALKNDRARIQVGRISHFGLLEMSRQRLRQGMVENTSLPCPHCAGRGIVRSVSSCALSVLRSIEEHLINRKPDNLAVRCDRDVAFYILNDKRDHLLALESAWGVTIYIEPSAEVMQADCEIESSSDRAASGRKAQRQSVKIDSAYDDAEEDEASADARSTEPESESEDQGRKRKRRRGRRGGRKSRDRSQTEDATIQAGEDSAGEIVEAAADTEPGAPEVESKADAPKKKKSRKRGRKQKDAVAAEAEPTEISAPVEDEEASADSVPASDQPVDEGGSEQPAKPKRARKPRKAVVTASEETETASEVEVVEDAPAPAEADETTTASETEDAPVAAEAEDAPASKLTVDIPEEHEEMISAESATGNGESVASSATTPAPRKWAPPAPTADPDAPRKTGWWSRR